MDHLNSVQLFIDADQRYIDNSEGVVLTSPGLKSYNVFMQINEGATFDNLIVKPMLSLDLETSYEDYEQYKSPQKLTLNEESKDVAAYLPTTTLFIRSNGKKIGDTYEFVYMEASYIPVANQQDEKWTIPLTSGISLDITYDKYELSGPSLPAFDGLDITLYCQDYFTDFLRSLEPYIDGRKIVFKRRNSNGIDLDPYFTFITDLNLVIEAVNSGNNDIIILPISQLNASSATFDVVDRLDKYLYPKKYYHQYKSNDNLYDSQTHKYLGKYLRYIRNLKTIDLMPFYNCFCGQSIDGYQVSNEGLKKLIYNSPYSVYMVPVRLEEIYTIALDCPSQVYICPAFLNNGDLISIPDSLGVQTDLTKIITNTAYSNVIQLASTSFNFPFTYKVNINFDTITDAVRRLMYSYQECLYLLIQVPKNNTSSLIVLEGDYTVLNSNTVVDINEIEKLSQERLDALLLSKLSLLSLDCKKQIPYSYKLIEYLLHNAISQNDELHKDIEMVQKYIGWPYYPSPTDPPGVWKNLYRKKSFDYQMEDRRCSKFDVTGYVDKNAEQVLSRRYQQYAE